MTQLCTEGTLGDSKSPQLGEQPVVVKSIPLWCTGCQSEVQARLTDGQELYPHRPDLYELPFWKCDTCGAYVGCHHKTKNRTAPLGCLASQDIMNARKKIHAILDPLWKSDRIKRGKAYAYVTNRMIKLTGDQQYQYHNGEIRSLEEARSVYRIVAQLHNEVTDLQATKPKSQDKGQSKAHK